MINIARFIDAISSKIGVLGALLLVLLSVLIVYDASMRAFFSQGSIMLQELQWHIFDAIMLLSIAYTLYYHRHVRVDIFYETKSERYKTLIDTVAYLFMVIPFSVVVIVVGYEFVMQSFLQLEASENPGGLSYRWIVKSLMVVGFVLLALQAVSHTIKNIELLIKKDSL